MDYLEIVGGKYHQWPIYRFLLLFITDIFSVLLLIPCWYYSSPP